MIWSELSDKDVARQLIKNLAIAGAYAYEIQRRLEQRQDGMTEDEVSKVMGPSLAIDNAIAVVAENLTFEEMEDVWRIVPCGPR